MMNLHMEPIDDSCGWCGYGATEAQPCLCSKPGVRYLKCGCPNSEEDVERPGICKLAFKIGPSTELFPDYWHYSDHFARLEDEHHRYCPVRIAAGKKAVSNFCLCEMYDRIDKEVEAEL